MVYSFDNNRRICDVVGQGFVPGSYNALKAFLFVAENKYCTFDIPRPADFNGPLNHVNISRYLGSEADDQYTVYAFERSGVGILDFKFGRRSFGLTQGIIYQILCGIIYLHSIDHIHTDLRNPDSFIFYQKGGLVHVKISVTGCFAIGSDRAGLHSKISNLQDFSSFMAKFFFGVGAEPGIVRTYNALTNTPPIRFLPCFLRKNAYVAEVFDLIKSAAGSLLPTVLSDPPSKPTVPLTARKLLNHAFFWTCERRLIFLHAAAEYVNPLSKGDTFLDKIDGISGFHNIVGPYWKNLNKQFRLDLRAPREPQGFGLSSSAQRQSGKPSFSYGPSSSAQLRSGKSSFAFGPSSSAQLRSGKSSFVSGPSTSASGPSSSSSALLGSGPFIGRDSKTSVSDFLRSLRNFIAHDVALRSKSKVKGVEVYTRYDAEMHKAFDLYLAIQLPSFFMSIYDVFRESPGILPSLENYLKPEFNPLLLG